MSPTDLLLLNFAETRRRSVILWKAIPKDFLDWKPDQEAFSMIEMIRHVLEGEHLFHKIIERRGDLGAYRSPWEGRAFTDVQEELDFAATFRAHFLAMVSTLEATDLESIRIERKEVGQSKLLGDYLNRMVYQEAVHCGQLLSYLRTADIPRPKIWD